MATAAFHISGIPLRTRAVREKIASSEIEGDEVILRSPLSAELPLNDHLVWLWGMLKHERRFLKSLPADGAKLFFMCTAKKGRFTIRPNAAEMLHLLEAELIVEAK